MTEILKALATMRSVPEDFLSSQHALPYSDLSGHLRPLSAELARLETCIDSGAPPKSPMEPLVVWRKWERANFETAVLNRREWRSLCVSPATASRPTLLAALNSDSSPLLRLSTLMGFVHVYFNVWRNTEEPQAMEALIAKALDHETIRNRGRVVACWRVSRFLFTELADVRLAERIVSGTNKPDTIRERFFLQKDTQLMRRATERAAELLVDRLITSALNLDAIEALKQMRFLQEVLLDSTFEPARFRILLTRLVLCELPTRFPAIQTLLVQWIHDDVRLGDPRLSTRAPNWRLVDQAARLRFLAWLAKETLEFFFNTIVPENDENRERATFWIAYARAGLIRDFNVVVARQDELLMRQSRAKFIPSYARLDANETNQTSAFLMVFEG